MKNFKSDLTHHNMSYLYKDVMSIANGLDVFFLMRFFKNNKKKETAQKSE